MFRQGFFSLLDRAIWNYTFIGMVRAGFEKAKKKKIEK